ncbi:MAG TPA: GTPase [Euryarchaeota archaeon]|nr:GTPase [Euryarchaeota archaeon]
MKRKVVIMGAAGRDFHNFNVFFRDNPNYEVIAFTAEQIPGIDDKIYPPELSGKLYPNGIPIKSESSLPEIIRENEVNLCVLAYSDLSFETVMHKASWVNSLGADFMLMGPGTTSLKSSKPVIAIVAVRTGCGKSQTTRKIATLLKNRGLKAAVIRHPMPYGELKLQRVQRFATFEDLDKAKCTIEEREEYEPHLEKGHVVYAGVDYAEILKAAEKEADIILWDGGNNDFPFVRSDLTITVVDPHRAGHEVSYWPGEVNLRLADVVVINKIDTASPEAVMTVRENIKRVNPSALIIEAASPLYVEGGDIGGRRVLVVEDGPTLTHGEMRYGAGYIASLKMGASEIVDPRPYAVGSIVDTFKKYTHLDKVLPAMGYGEKQIKELEETINRVPADLVVAGTPIDLRRIVKVNKPVVRVRYELQEVGQINLEYVLDKFLTKKGLS